MISRKELVTILIASFVITLCIFTIGLMLNYGLDFSRIDTVINSMTKHQINSDAYVLQDDFFNEFGGNKCSAMKWRIDALRIEIKKVGNDLTDYGAKSVFQKTDFDYLKRKYFLLEMEFYNFLNKYNSECSSISVPVLFFYKIDDSTSATQGYVLEDISLSYRENVSVLSFDINYTDEDALNMLKTRFNITRSPTTVIGNSVIFDALTYTGPINNTIIRMLKQTDKYGKNINFSYVLAVSGINKTEYIRYLNNQYSSTDSEFAKADILLILGRITENESMICSALPHYDSAMESATDPAEKAIMAESIVSIGCGRNRNAFLTLASGYWKENGAVYREEIDSKLAVNENPQLTFETSDVLVSAVNISTSNISAIIIGASNRTITARTMIVSQSDRVSRDWLSAQIGSDMHNEEFLSVFSERFTYNSSELAADIGWHEGARLAEIRSESNATVKPAYGTLVAKKDGKWYAPNENGIFMFEVPIDKLSYPTTRFLSENLAVIVDTHGINMLVDQAVRNNATVVVGCCDYPGKIKAVKYLSDKFGISTICFTDKYLPTELLQNVSALGSPPFIGDLGNVIVGARPLAFKKNQLIIVQNMSTDKYGISYYDTPTRYFFLLQNITSDFFNITYVTNTDHNQVDEVISTAKSLNAHAVAVRVFNSYDYGYLSEWLNDSPENKAILFHSESYPYGYLLFANYPTQTTFDDINPLFVNG